MPAENNGFDCLQTLHFHFQVETETSAALTDDHSTQAEHAEPTNGVARSLDVTQ